MEKALFCRTLSGVVCPVRNVVSPLSLKTRTLKPWMTEPTVVLPVVKGRRLGCRLMNVFMLLA